MKKIWELLEQEIGQAFVQAGYDATLGKIVLSNRPDLCEYQCNGAMAGAKTYHKAPLMIAEDVVKELGDSLMIGQAQAVKPGFINLNLKPSFLAEYGNKMWQDEKLGVEMVEDPQTILVDYGGPNVAKPLHVGHLRSAIIGESVKRIARYMGHKVIGDIHMGDWGYQMGLIITELKKRCPKLPYFQEDYSGDYPKEAPFTIGELEEIYPAASAYAKEHEEYRKEALEATYLLQTGHPGYRALWQHIMHISVEDLKKNYENLQVSFDLWKGESDVQVYIPDMVERLKKEGYAHQDQGALVVDVKEDTDTKEIPPCMILKSDGAALYDTTDLATLVEREKLYQPDRIIYVVDKRQALHFVQVFRCAKKTGIVPESTSLEFLGFGTMNGKDGKPFKTREGGVMRLETLIRDIDEQMYQKIAGNREIPEEEARQTAKKVALSAIKYGDLSNQASKDYVFDPERFLSFEGNTGPYLLYTIVRIKSILSKYEKTYPDREAKVRTLSAETTSHEKALLLMDVRFGSMLAVACEESAPHKICAYLYDLANEFNKFYHETPILNETDAQKQEGYIALLQLTKKILETGIYLLGFEAPDRM